MLNAVRRHADHEKLLAHAFEALCNLVFPNKLHSAAADANVVSLVLGAMSRHLDSPQVQAEACCLLHNLACGLVGVRCRRQMREDGEAARLSNA